MQTEADQHYTNGDASQLTREAFIEKSRLNLVKTNRAPLSWIMLELVLILVAGSASAETLGNLSPADALKAFETEPGFMVTLVAAEPLTIDPVALAFDERGRSFVAEGRDYPVGSPDRRNWRKL